VSNYTKAIRIGWLLSYLDFIITIAFLVNSCIIGFMSELIHPQVEQIAPVQTPEAWTPTDEAMFHEYAGSAAVAQEVKATIDASTEDLARQQAEAIAANQTHRVTSGKAVGFARVAQPGLQLTDIDREAYVRTQQTLFVAEQAQQSYAERARAADEESDEELIK
jgi:hypothetical protein